jgi:hypothetical protein
MVIKSLLQPYKETDTWKWGIVVLTFLAPFFFLSYGFANQYAAHLINVPSIVFEWEKYIPLWPWTIIPYWSIDLFYGLSLLLCWNKFELKQQTLRLITAQIIAVSSFLLFPLKFSVERPELEGFLGFWFEILMEFDQPFNQAPSLHIVLLIILWDFYRRHWGSRWKYIVDLWSLLIGVSVLTTWQHHFIDVPTGILVGAFCLWLFPVSTLSPLQKSPLQSPTPKHYKISTYYFISAGLLFSLAFIVKSLSFLFIYPAISCLLISIAYLTARPHFFQKQNNHKMSAASYILFTPYFIFAWLNSRLWTYKHPKDVHIITLNHCAIFLGRIPRHQNLQHYDLFFDCCAELPTYPVHNSSSFFSLDLIPLNAQQLHIAVKNFEQLIQAQSLTYPRSNLLISCALGYSRSSVILIGYLLKSKNAQTVKDAMQIIQTARPWVIINKNQIEQLHYYHIQLKEFI